MEQVINDYILEVEGNLSALPKQDRKDVIEFYREFLLDGEFNDRTAIEKELGTPQQLARKIVGDYSVNESGETNTEHSTTPSSSSSNVKTIWHIIVGICAVPTGIIIGIPIICIFIGLLAGLIGLFIGFIGLVVGILAGGAFAALISFNFLFTSNWAVGLFYLGAGLTLISISLFLIPILIIIIRFLIAKCAQFARFLGKKLFKKHYYQTKSANKEV
ncbi:DUF1700 domain-containing protein [Lactobacillus sp. ESL0785]|uniref:DUF1700 domain-containing protein n=1 Tax=Lactobacillus sp. ESL0785 TaxID=2983232 RepID=UPI0023F8FBEF|nr:DUF1700 domain-containing protein [Lactobacillus sp. ESL0785]WEV70947.1 DUF1700 domain-containing protein [Lactobacillus sp. ESL0785]